MNWEICKVISSACLGKGKGKREKNLMYHKFYEKCGTHGIFICIQLLHSFLFHKVETHKIKALGFLLEFLKGKSFKFLKKKHIKICLINILDYILEFKKSRFTFTFLQCIQVEFNSQKNLMAVTPAFYFILVPKCRL